MADRLEYRGECPAMGASFRLTVEAPPNVGTLELFGVDCPFGCSDRSHPLRPVTETQRVLDFLRQRAERYRAGAASSTLRDATADALFKAAQDIEDGAHRG